ncbi:MAG: hypothetical protein M1816_001947 [Peltula sp. TS41687]|nr:MAG: hypothetical protein M1816_001947 [Peltula sp. TS41687]
MAYSIVDNSRMEDDLSSLLSNQLSLSNHPLPDAQISTHTASPSSDVQTEQPIRYSVSQHYHHSAHLAPPRPAVDSQPQNPAGTDQLTAEIILARNGVDPNALFPTQLTLFRQADVSQQMRLIQLWRISPSDYGTQAYALEFEQGATAQGGPRSQQVPGSYQDEMQDVTDTPTKVVEMGMTDASDHTDRSSATSSTTNHSGQQHGDIVPAQSAEPYIVSGYETLARRDYDQAWQQQQQQREKFSPLGSAVGHTQQYLSALDPVYQHRNAGSDGIVGQENLSYQSGMFPQGVQYRGLLTAVPSTFAGGEDQEML